MKAKLIGIALACAVAAAVVYAIVFVGPVEVTPPKKDEFEGWNRSGPFAINKHQYKLGENIFIAVGGLAPTEAGNMVFVMPNGTTKYISIPFNGTLKSGFNQYFKPDISKNRKICDTAELVGQWTVLFTNTNYPPIKFKIINETLPGEETRFERVC